MAQEYEREESEAEKLDRNWDELLQELRVVQTGVQLLSGFLLTLPFSQRFSELDHWQTRLYLAIMLVAATAVGLTLIPIVVHRRVFQQQVKPALLGRAIGCDSHGSHTDHSLRRMLYHL